MFLVMKLLDFILWVDLLRDVVLPWIYFYFKKICYSHVWAFAPNSDLLLLITSVLWLFCHILPIAFIITPLLLGLDLRLECRIFGCVNFYAFSMDSFQCIIIIPIAKWSIIYRITIFISLLQINVSCLIYEFVGLLLTIRWVHLRK